MPEDKKEAEETHAYTPGLKIKNAMIIEKERRLPIAGEVLVNLNDEVADEDIVAEALVPGDPEILSAAMKLGTTADIVPELMLKKVGDHVKIGEMIAQYSFLFGLFKRSLESPVNGTIETISKSTGQVILRKEDMPVNVDAYIPGKVTKVNEKEGVVITTHGAFMQGIFGIGGEKRGTLRLVIDSPEGTVTANDIKPEDKDKILVGGGLLTLDALKKAVEVGVAGIVVGGIDSGDLMEFMGTDVGVAITGEEDYGITLIVTEGFGKMAMHMKTHSIFKEHDGKRASINGATQIRAGVIRPEIVIPHQDVEEDSDEDSAQVGMVPGTPLRIIREPYFGKICTLVRLPVELQKVDSGSKVRVLEAKLDDGTLVTVPRANVEMIEE